MACSACEKSRLARLQQKNQQVTPVVTPIDNLTPGDKIPPQNQNQPSEKFQRVRVLPPQRG